MKLLTTASDLAKAMGLVSTAVRERPAYVIFQLTRRCNLRCDFCDFHLSPTRPTDELDLAGVETLTERLATLGPSVVCLSGGEPTIRKDLPDVTRIVAKRHFPTLITNGWFMTRGLARDLFDAGMEEISVSIDYATPERHDARRGIDGSWARAVAALGHLRAASDGWRHRVYMNGVLLDDNTDEVEPLLRLAADLNVTFRLSLYSPHRGSVRPPAPGVTERLLALKAKYPHFVSLTGYLRGADQALGEGVPGCRAGRLFMFVDAAGDVFRCVEQKDPAVGNLLADDAKELLTRLRAQSDERPCSACWTSTRGAIEAILGARARLPSRVEFLSSLRG